MADTLLSGTAGRIFLPIRFRHDGNYSQRIFPHANSLNRLSSERGPIHPPKVQRAGMPMPNRLLTSRLGIDGHQWQRDFDQLFAVRFGHSAASALDRGLHRNCTILARMRGDCNLCNYRLLQPSSVAQYGEIGCHNWVELHN